MGTTIPFTSNYSDVSTYDGYQYEFRCMRCGNGHVSQFRHSVTGFGGRLASLAGAALGGEIGSRIESVGMLSEYGRSGTRGSTNDKRLIEASHDVADQFMQCRGCGTWVCRSICWNATQNCCTSCAPPQPQGMPVVGMNRCTACGASGTGRFCGQCGSPYGPAACTGCGSPLTGSRFCGNCGTPAP